MYTPSQVSEMLSIPVSTLRRLSSQLSELLSSQRSRHRRYTEQDISILKRAREMTGQGMSLEQIRQALSLVETPASEQEKPGDTLALIPAIAQELERFDTTLRQVLSEMETLKAGRETDRARIAELEHRLALPWYKKIFGKPQ